MGTARGRLAGFSLVELLVVIAIIALLLALL
jgi:prepilin-type N-terminal cleavage/methylation domain-containing protein